MSEAKELVEVTVKLPKKLVQTLEALHYLGWTPDEFFDNAARNCLSATVSEMDIRKSEQLEKKYGEEMFLSKYAPVLGLEKSGRASVMI